MGVSKRRGSTRSVDTWHSVGYQQLSEPDDDGLTVPAGALFATIQPETVSVRWRADGVAPTSTVGNLIAANETFTFPAAELGDLRITQVSAGAKVNVNYYG